MPIIQQSSYRPPLAMRWRHTNTIYPGLIRRVEGIEYSRERQETPDDDFFDLDWSRVGGDRLIIALHGLEGGADRPYIQGVVKLFNEYGWDGIGFNFRSCSGEMNQKWQSYHMGFTNDLDLILRKIIATGHYREIALVGFSLGGNVLLKYLGEQGANLPKEISKAVAFSVPVHIESANIKIGKWFNRAYMSRFMDSLNGKLIEKAEIFDEPFPLDRRRLPRNFVEFDSQFTAPFNGFRDARDYWTSSSSLRFIPNIRIPTLLVNAQDDSFLSDQCFPFDLAEKMPNFFLETPRFGGHVGFVSFNGNNVYWSEKRTLEFVLNSR